MRTGLDVLLSEPSKLRGARVALCCNHTAVDHNLDHAIDLLGAAGVRLVRLFGPEHGVRATAQDMEGVDEVIDPVSGLPTVSLYGSTEASLRPARKHLEDVDVVVFDIQDIGARYYTYQATLGFVMEVAGATNTRVVVLDRPNPINGVSVEGNVVRAPFHSFVGAYPIAVRHGMTVGELAHYFVRHCGVRCDFEVVPCEGWERTQWFDQTGLPWVYPSPNMPTLDTAVVYPGMCLIEATNLSEGRGTTRPFHLVGAPWIDPMAFTAAAKRQAAAAGLKGVAFRPAAFKPGFQKHAGVDCGGLEVHVVDRARLNALLLGLVIVAAAMEIGPMEAPGQAGFGWRHEPYEFISGTPAVDLLTGSVQARELLEGGGAVADLLPGWEADRAEFMRHREACLLY
jgi:uncharacterized protein YbbC (DUF1343 family)